MTEKKKPIQIFGDESHFKGVITYALLIVPLPKLSDVELEVYKVKDAYGIPRDAVVHCSALFNEEKKSRTAFKSLSFEQTMSLLGDVVLNCYFAGARAWIGYLDPAKIPDGLIFERQNGEAGLEMMDIRSIKSRTIFVSQAAMAPVTHFIPHHLVDAWIDHEPTKILHLHNPAKRRVDQLSRFFPVNHNNEMLVPTPIAANKPVFLEVADILAYASSHALYGGVFGKKSKFVEIVNLAQPGYSEVLFESIAGPMGSVRAFDRDKAIEKYLLTFLAR